MEQDEELGVEQDEELGVEKDEELDVEQDEELGVEQDEELGGNSDLQPALEQHIMLKKTLCLKKLKRCSTKMRGKIYYVF